MSFQMGSQKRGNVTVCRDADGKGGWHRVLMGVSSRERGGEQQKSETIAFLKSLYCFENIFAVRNLPCLLQSQTKHRGFENSIGAKDCKHRR